MHFFSECVIKVGVRHCLLVADGQVIFDYFNIFALKEKKILFLNCCSI